MQRKMKVIAGSTLAVVVIGLGTGVAVASNGGGDDNDTPISGEALDRASAAALEFTAGGRVTETEVGDEESYYEVEVTMDDGTQIDVQLDKDFTVVGDKVDSERDDADDQD